MTQDDKDLIAAEYVLGTLEAEDRDAFARDLAESPELQAMVEDWERRLGPLSDAVVAENPPPDLWGKIQAGLVGPDGNLPGTRTIPAGEGDWIPMAPGVERKLLFANEEEGMRSFLVRFAPGGRYTSHPHQRIEECLVLEGELSFGTLRLNAGDFHLATPGVTHPEAVSESGCLLYIRGEIRASAA
ncbi:MAG: cupin domain-containing protein [Alphaproteobacteria bacterium]|nr:cupin domain-containing protein [Alphaproteobacteria bacterium]